MTLRGQRLTREARTQQTKALLREAALREFAENGVAGTSAERIAEAAGFTRGAFYVHFENKEALLLDLLREKLDIEAPKWRARIDGAGDIAEAMPAVEQVASEHDPEGVWALISIEAYLLALRDPQQGEEYLRYHEAIKGTTVRFLTRLFERAGKLAPAPIEELAEIMVLLSMTLSLPLPMTSTSKGQRAPTKAADRALIVLNGFLASGKDLPASTRRRRTK